MFTPASFPNISLETIIDRILTFRQITTLDYQLLKSAILSGQSFSDIDQLRLDQVFEGLKNGLIWVGS